MKAPSRGFVRRFVQGWALVSLVTCWQATLPADRHDLSVGLDRIRALDHDGKYNEAEALARDVLADAEREYGPRSPEAADALDRLVSVLPRTEHRREPKTLELAERAVQIREASAGKAPLALAGSLENLIDVLRIDEQLKRARELLLRAIEIRKRASGEEDRDVAADLRRLGDVDADLGDYARAEELLQQALDTQRRVLGPRDPDVALTLNSIGSMRFGQGRFEDAASAYQEALDIRREYFGNEHPMVAVNLHNLALTSQRLGDYTKARQYHEEALRIRTAVFPADHPQIASTAAGLASLLHDMGEYASARLQYQRAVEVEEKRIGVDHPRHAQTLSDMALLAEDSGDLDEARRLQEQALAIRLDKLGPDHIEVAESLSRLGTVLLRQGDLTGARRRFEAAFRIQPFAASTGHPDRIRAAIGLASAEERSGELVAARKLYERTIADGESVYGPHHPVLLTPLLALASLERTTGDLDGARALYRRAAELAEAEAGAGSPQFADALLGDARVLRQLRRSRESLDLALRANAIDARHVTETSRLLPERSSLAYSASRGDALDLALALLSSDDGTAESTAAVWDAVVQARGRILDEMAARHRAVGPGAGPETARLAEAYRQSRQHLANLMLQGPERLPPGHHARLVEQARIETERTELKLAESSLDWRNQRAAREIGLKQIRSSLPRDAALTAFVRYDDPPNGGAYLAFVQRPDRDEPVLVRLGNTSEIDAAVSAWRAVASRDDRSAGGDPAAWDAAIRREGDALRRRVWDPVAAQLTGLARVLIVPDGSLDLVNFAALPMGKGYLIEDDRVLHVLTTEKDVVGDTERSSRGVGLLAVGGVDFDARAAGSSKPALVRGLPRTCEGFDAVRFGALPATREEVRDIAALWSTDRGKPRSEQPIELLGAAASEAAFKAAAPGKRVLHLATHGFFLDSDCHSGAPGSRGIGGLAVAGSQEVDGGEDRRPLSGLALAGANRRAAAFADEEDGVLTAEEIALLDLSGVEWAVLSACDTGIGEIRSGEGVFGLRRAFREAGARTVIMSLWSVEDQAARRWMRELYKARFEGLDTAEAVRKAGLAVLRYRRERGSSTHPFYWAGWVAAGDWR